MRASGRPSAALPDCCLAMLLEALPQSRRQLSEGIPGMAFARSGALKSSQNESQMAPRRPLGASWPPEGLLEWSGRALGAVLGGSRTEKSPLDRLLAAPRGFPREVSAILGAKGVPKGSPKWVQNKVQKRFKLKLTKNRKT